MNEGAGDWLARVLRRHNDQGRAAGGESNQLRCEKPCPVAGCGGTMQFREAMRAAPVPHTLEWPWLASWVCDRDEAHYELVHGAK
jgi:hypothetical protein